MASGFSILAFLFMLIGQGRGDLLDCMSTDAYWQAKHVQVTNEALITELVPPAGKVDITKELKDLESDQFAVRDAAKKKIEAAGPGALEQLQAATASTDPEVAGFAKQMVTRYTAKTHEAQIRRLMAIRTLGEHKVAAALPALQKLSTSKDLFVADYASRALAQIAGKPWTVAVDAAAGEADLWLLPTGTGLVAQTGNADGARMTITSLIAALPDSALKQGNVTREVLTTEAAAKMLAAAEQVGNVRLDHLTLGLSDAIGGNSGWAAFIASGKFDPEALAPVLSSIGPHRGGAFDPMKTREEGGLKITEMENTILIIQGDHRLIFIAGPSPEQMHIAADAIIKALSTGGNGKGGLSDNADMVKALKQVDHNKALWAVVTKIPDEIKQEPMFAAFEKAAGFADVKDGVISWTVQATGTDADAVAKAVTALNENIQQGIASLSGGPPQVAEMTKPLVEVMNTIKATNKDTGATLVGQAKVETLAYGIGMGFMSMRQMDGMMEGGRPPMRVNAPVTTAPAKGDDFVVPAPQ